MGPILYLDYDGVLHPSDVRITKAEPLRPRIYQNGRPTDRLLFENAPLLACILEAFPEVRISLAVKIRQVIHAFREQFRAFFLPFLERLNRGLVLERSLWNAVVVDLDVITQRRFQLGG
jgi:hypothetical protein